MGPRTTEMVCSTGKNRIYFIRWINSLNEHDYNVFSNVFILRKVTSLVGVVRKQLLCLVFFYLVGISIETLFGELILPNGKIVY